jgi:hypothetical protein
VAKLAACRPCLATPFTWRSGVARVAAPSTTTGRLLVQLLTQDRRGGQAAIRNRKGTRSNRGTGHSGRFHRQIQGTSLPFPRSISRLDIPLSPPTRPTPSSITIEDTARCCVTLPCIQALIFHLVRKFGIVEHGDTCPTSSCRIFFRRASLQFKDDASIS